MKPGRAIGLGGQIWLWVYGILAGLLAFMLTGAGHATLMLLQLVGSPFTALGSYWFMLSLYVGSLQWGTLGTLFSYRVIGRKSLAGYLLLHYVVAAVLLSKFGDWEYARRLSWGLLVTGFGFYATGQVYLWWVILRGERAVPADYAGENSV